MQEVIANCYCSLGAEGLNKKVAVLSQPSHLILYILLANETEKSIQRVRNYFKQAHCRLQQTFWSY